MKVLPAEFVARYARPPSETTIQRAISLHENVRALLGDVQYATVLQGSYKNDTALADMNDVDVLVVDRAVQSKAFGFWRESHNWQGTFSAIETKLDSDHRYRGKWKRADKCIRLATSVCVDIVPAIHCGDPSQDPVAIFSFSSRAERKNWPRSHYEAAAKKSGETSGAFKQVVRLFKRWARCHFTDTKVAPSYYIECLMHSLPSTLYTGDLAADFVSLSSELLQRYRHGAFIRAVLPRPAGEGDLLDESEWGRSRFESFRRALEESVVYARAALTETDVTRASAAWRRAFAGHNP